MRYDEFPVPVTLLPDETEFDARILVHRRVAVDHVDHCDCPCEPHSFTRSEAMELTVEKLNALLGSEVH